MRYNWNTSQPEEKPLWSQLCACTRMTDVRRLDFRDKGRSGLFLGDFPRIFSGRENQFDSTSFKSNFFDWTQISWWNRPVKDIPHSRRTTSQSFWSKMANNRFLEFFRGLPFDCLKRSSSLPNNVISWVFSIKIATAMPFQEWKTHSNGSLQSGVNLLRLWMDVDAIHPNNKWME